MSKGSKKKVVAETICSKCHGTGKESLPAILSEPLAIIAKHDGIDTNELLKIYTMRIKVNHSAMNQRLSKLFSFGLVTRERRGKLWVWRIAV